MLSIKWKSAATETDEGQMSKLRKLKENLIFGTFWPIDLVVAGKEELQDQRGERVIPSLGTARSGNVG